MLQSLFPTISAQRAPLSFIHRVLILDRQPMSTEGDKPSSEYTIDVRHYIISTKPLVSFDPFNDSTLPKEAGNG